MHEPTRGHEAIARQGFADPLYQQVVRQVRWLITDGELAAGEHLPNEIALTETFSL